MDIICTCSCGAKFKVGEHAAGKKARCPKCSAVVQVPPAGGASTAAHQPAAAPAKPAPPPIRTSSAAGPAIDPVKMSGSATASSAPLFDTGGPAKPGHSRPPAKKLNPMLLMGGGGAAAALLVVVVIVLMMSSGTPEPAPAPKVAKAPGQGTLVFDWPEDERANASLSVDSKNVAVPATGPIEVKVKAGKHTVGILRKQYEPVRREILIAQETSETFRPQWKEVVEVASNKIDSPFKVGSGIVVPGFEGWQQVLAVAKEQAAAEKKDLLMVFGSTDGNPNTSKLARSLKAAGLPDGELGQKFVPVVIDLPQTGDGRNRVIDLRQNITVAHQFGVTAQELPVLALADEKGRPFGLQREWPGGVAEVAQVIATLSKRRDERDQLLAAASEGPEAQQLDGAVAFVKWLLDNKVMVQYRDDIHPWWELANKADPDNAAGKQEVILEAEMFCQIRELPEGAGPVEIVRRFDLLEPWLKDRKFADADRGFKLHFIAGNILGRLGEEDGAIAHIQQAWSYEPTDPELKEAWQGIAPLVSNSRVLSSGTGFVVANGYILTNRHVVDGRGSVAVRIPEVKDPVPAKSVKVHEKLDIALIEIDLPASYQPRPVGLSTKKLNRGLEVGAFGYPQGDALGQDLKFTKGSISSLPNASLDNMILLDIRINPGNSGGPLCDVQGNVVGMITAKIGGGGAIDSFGMAIPVEELDKFLTTALPASAKRGEPRPAKSGSTWDEVDPAISPAVLMIVKLR